MTWAGRVKERKIPFPNGVPRWHPQACHWLEEIPIFVKVHRKLFGFFVEGGGGPEFCLSWIILLVDDNGGGSGEC